MSGKKKYQAPQLYLLVPEYPASGSAVERIAFCGRLIATIENTFANSPSLLSTEQKQRWLQILQAAKQTKEDAEAIENLP